MAKKVDVASIKSDYEEFRAQQAKQLEETLTDLKAQKAELEQQIAHLEAVQGELTGEKKAAPAKSGGKGR